MTKLNTRAELSAAIAEKVMRWDYADKWGNWYSNGKPQRATVYNPAEDLNHAFEALEKAEVAYPRVWQDDDGWSALVIRHNRYKDRQHASHKSLAVAICLALLQAAGVEYELGGELL